MGKREPILKDTCLCAIVRNEEINPAGGIVPFCERHLPLFHAAEIVDTGSTDRTPNMLLEMQKKFPWMRVHFDKFRGYAGSRNFCLEKAREAEAIRVMVLDADERFREESARHLAQRFEWNPQISAWSFNFRYIYPDGSYDMPDGMNPRVFKLGPNVGFLGQGELGDNEYPYPNIKSSGWRHWASNEELNNTIEHFCPTKSAFKEKVRRVYGRVYSRCGYGWEVIREGLPRDESIRSTHPSKLPWKQLNPLSSKFDVEKI